MALLSNYAVWNFSETTKNSVFREAHLKRSNIGKKTLTFDIFENRGLLKKYRFVATHDLDQRRGFQKQQKYEAKARKQQQNNEMIWV